MKITYHENGWTPIITDIDLREATQEEINEIVKLECKHSVVVIKGQTLTPQDELRIARMIGEVEEFPDVDFIRGKSIAGTEHAVLRVSGKPDENGNLGLWPTPDELEWHANNPGDPNRHDNIWLYGVEGTAGSRTSFANTQRALEFASDEDKALFEKLRVYVRAWFPHHKGSSGLAVSEYPLVMKNAAGYNGMFFPIAQVIDVLTPDEVESSRRAKMKLIVKIKRYIVEDRFVYHHDWEDGDLVLSDQWLSIHKRWHFEGIANRVLHRIATRVNGVFPNAE